jgi:hypothetical protein
MASGLISGETNDRRRLEQLCCYTTRPALSDERVQLNAAGQVELKLNTPWRDGTTHLVMSPLEFMQRLAEPVPWPSLRRAIQPGSGRSRTTLDGRLLPLNTRLPLPAPAAQPPVNRPPQALLAWMGPSATCRRDPMAHSSPSKATFRRWPRYGRLTLSPRSSN